MTFIDIYNVITKLVGPIEPVGESNADEKRYENLQTMTEVVGELLADIKIVSRYVDRPEASMSKIGRYAQTFLKDVRNDLPSHEEN